MSRKKKNHHEEHIDETWLIPYADILTLLLALFIVLFATSAVDVAKFEQLARSLNIALTGGVGVMEFQDPLPSNDPSTIPTKDVTKDNENDPEQQEIDKLLEQFIDQNDLLTLTEIQKKINRYIHERNLELSLQTKLTKEGLLITILDNALFTSGSAVMRPDAQVLAREISQFLVTEPPRQIEISGHTDNVPIGRNSSFRSNWDLSVMRAVNFLKILLENPDLEPANYQATGHGEFKPVASNVTEEGRSKNRRVEVLILPFKVE